MSVYAM